MTDQDSSPPARGGSSPDRLQHLLDEVGVTADPGLLRVLGEISELGAGPAPEASAELAVVLSADDKAAVRSRRRRITFIGGALAVSMGAGMSGVAAETFELSAGAERHIDSVTLSQSPTQRSGPAVPGIDGGAPGRGADADRGTDIGGSASASSPSAPGTADQIGPPRIPEAPMLPRSTPSGPPAALPPASSVPESTGGAPDGTASTGHVSVPIDRSASSTGSDDASDRPDGAVTAARANGSRPVTSVLGPPAAVSPAVPTVPALPTVLAVPASPAAPAPAVQPSASPTAPILPERELQGVAFSAIDWDHPTDSTDPTDADQWWFVAHGSPSEGRGGAVFLAARASGDFPWSLFFLDDFDIEPTEEPPAPASPAAEWISPAPGSAAPDPASETPAILDRDSKPDAESDPGAYGESAAPTPDIDTETPDVDVDVDVDVDADASAVSSETTDADAGTPDPDAETTDADAGTPDPDAEIRDPGATDPVPDPGAPADVPPTQQDTTSFTAPSVPPVVDEHLAPASGDAPEDD